MSNYQTLVSIVEVLLVTVPSLLTVAFITIADRKTTASMQRRLGRNATGYLGSPPLQSSVSYVSGLTFVFFTPEFKE